MINRMLSLTVDDATIDRLARLAVREEMSKSALVRHLILEATRKAEQEDTRRKE